MKKVDNNTFEYFLSNKSTKCVLMFDDLDFKEYNYVCTKTNKVLAQYTEQERYDEITSYGWEYSYYICE